MEKMKSFIKKSKVLYWFLSGIMKIFIYITSVVNPRLASKILFRLNFGKKLSLDNPQTLNEKMMYLKLNKYWNNQLVSNCADKFAVRDIIIEKGCPEILNELFGSWDEVDEIDWNALPEKFVLKCNHGSGYNVICTNKEELDIEESKKKLNKWLKQRYGVRTVEQGIYKKIKRKVIAERYIETEDNMPPKDYKFFCSFGEVKFLFVASDRINNQTKFDYYYPDWTWIPVKNQHPNMGPISKPKMLDKMIQYAQILSKDFPLVRIDFYFENSHIIFGEYTFAHFGCLNTFDPQEYDLILGQCFPKIDELLTEKNRLIS